jgi:hypothetical protein
MDDWQVIAIHQNVTEGLRLFKQDPNAKQVFYYDDFLGQISTGEKLGKNEDRALLQLIASIARTGNKRFVLTTREYILAQAKAEHEQLARSNIDLYKFVVKCEDYSELDKARILANHLYFARVPQEHIAALVEGRAYRNVISHRNYSPRVIEWMTNATAISVCPAAQYPKVFLERLDNPSDLWKHAFENQISEAARHILLVLASCGDGLCESDLQEAFDSFFSHRAQLYGFTSLPTSFKSALNELEGNFIRIDRSESRLSVSFHNPSVLDFLKQRFSQSDRDVADLIRSAVFFEQLQRLFLVFRGEGNTDQVAKAWHGIDPKTASDAIERTLLARIIEFINERKSWESWNDHLLASSVWNRLKTCCQIGSEIPDVDLRMSILANIDAQMVSVSSNAEQVADITSLLDFLGQCEWRDQKLLTRWNDMLFKHLFATDYDLQGNLEYIAATAKWFVGHRPQFGKKKASVFAKNLDSLVSLAVSDDCRQRGAPHVLDRDLAILQEIAGTLGHDFSEEKDKLNEAISEWKSSNVGRKSSTLQELSPETYQVPIDGIFEALIE